ncbi:MAG: diacylglycerol O-acyltransferase / wax synthase [Solirubrobacteraceae bacterium]|nr:diacylglycerol O-acyltransferase / wax synthase [Solirubrobacteraceae bacterium]
MISSHCQRLSPVDDLFLQLESPSAHMHVGWSAICSVPESGTRPTIEAMRERVAGRLALMPRCRQRLLPASLGLTEPRWVDDPHFDLNAHVFELSDPDEEISLARFAELRDALLSMPLDRSRPLWQMALAPRLAGGRLGFVGRVHHAMADGAAAFLVGALVLDTGEEEPAAPPEHWRAQATPNLAQRALDPILHGAGLTSRAVVDTARAASHPRTTARSALRDAKRVASVLAQDFLPLAPNSALNGTIGPRRTLVSFKTELSELRTVSRNHAGTLNDVGLAIVSGALRTLALERGREPEPLKAHIPVDVRRAHERGSLGNHVSIAMVWLPLDSTSAAVRLEHIRAQTRSFKHGSRPEGARTLLSGVSLLPSAMRGLVARTAASRRGFNLTVSSIPGPRSAMYMLGARLDEIYPVVPIADEHALSIGILAYRKHLHFGLYADPDAMPDATHLPDLLADEVRALRPAEARRAPARPRAMATL